MKEHGFLAGEIEKLTPSLVRRKLCYAAIPADATWTVNMAKELIAIRDGRLEVPGFGRSEINEMLTHCCTN